MAYGIYYLNVSRLSIKFAPISEVRYFAKYSIFRNESLAPKNALKVTATLVSSTFCSLAYGSGFAIQKQSITALGRAFVGSAAVADDDSTIFLQSCRPYAI